MPTPATKKNKPKNLVKGNAKKVAIQVGMKNLKNPLKKKTKSSLPKGRIKKAALLAVIDSWGETEE
jgi:hypothetical protein